MSSTRSNWALSFTSRHAAPMQNRVTPWALARFAVRTTSSTPINGCGLTPVS